MILKKSNWFIISGKYGKKILPRVSILVEIFTDRKAENDVDDGEWEWVTLRECLISLTISFDKLIKNYCYLFCAT